MSVMSAAEAGQAAGTGPDLPVPRRRLRVATPAPQGDRSDGPDSLFGPAPGTPAGPGVDADRPWLTATEVGSAEVRSTELRVREVRVVRRASTRQRRVGVKGQAGGAVRGQAGGAVRGQAGAVQHQASEVAARTSSATQARAASYTRATGVPGAPGAHGMPIATRSRMVAQSRTVTQTRIVARTRTTTQRPGAIRLTRRGRWVVAGFAMLVVIATATVLWMTAAGSVQASSEGGPPASPYQGMTQVVVGPGQTLWSIAAGAEPSANTWAVVQQITEVNALNGTTVHAGQQLWVPKG
jgi:hypothetical protein